VDNVQATAWIIEPGEFCYAVANVGSSTASVGIEISPPDPVGKKIFEVTALRSGPKPESLGGLATGDWLEMELAPRELLYLMIRIAD
jgi:hypothetical protein